MNKCRCCRREETGGDWIRANICSMSCALILKLRYWARYREVVKNVYKEIYG